MKKDSLLNIAVTPIALKLRTLRLQKDLSIKTLSTITNISEDNIVSFETGKKVPDEVEKKILFDVLN